MTSQLSSPLEAPPTTLWRSFTRFPWLEAAVAVAGLCAISASVALGLGQLQLGKELSDFVLKNNVQTAKREFLLSMLPAVAGVTAMVSLVALAAGGRSALRSFQWLTRFACPLFLFWALPALFTDTLAADRPATYLLLLAGTVLGVERLLRISLDCVKDEWTWRTERIFSRVPAVVRRRAAPVVVVIAATGFVAREILQSPTPNAMFVLHVVVLGGAAVPLFYFGCTQLPRYSAALVAIVYLLFAPMHGSIVHGFRWLLLTIPLWFTLFHAAALRRTGIVVAAALLTLFLRYESGLMLAGLGIFLLATGHWPRLGVVLAAAGVAWFLGMHTLVPRSDRVPESATIYRDLLVPGESGSRTVLFTVLSNPNYVWKTLTQETVLVYLLHLLGPLLLLPVRRLVFVMVLVPSFLFAVFVTRHEETLTVLSLDTVQWVPWLFATLVLAMRVLQEDAPKVWVRRRSAALALCLGVFAHSYVYGDVLKDRLEPPSRGHSLRGF